MPLLPLAWMQGAPWYEETKRRHGISHLVKAVCERSDIQLIATSPERALFADLPTSISARIVEFVPGEIVNKRVVAGYLRPPAASLTDGEPPITALRPLATNSGSRARSLPLDAPRPRRVLFWRSPMPFWPGSLRPSSWSRTRH